MNSEARQQTTGFFGQTPDRFGLIGRTLVLLALSHIAVQLTTTKSAPAHSPVVNFRSVGRPDRSELRRMDDECLVDRPAVSFCIREGSSTAGAVAVDTPGKAHECRRLGHCHDRFESQWVAMRIVAIGDSAD
jgi:hypothetical protein